MQEFLAVFNSDFIEPFGKVGWPSAALRLFSAALFGGFIGWERERRAKAAGLRTHMIVSVAACLFTLIAFDLMTVPPTEDDMLQIDPLRLIEAVTSGVAFLAAGVIFMSGGRPKGLTTGAGMWLAGAIGLACGIGNLVLAAMATALAIAILWLLSLLPAGSNGDSGDNG
jgi:putative Mg2+ transporter-C (MgtC) family protein